MPFQANESPTKSVADGSATAGKEPREIARLDIPSPRDAVVTAYSEWQQSNVVDKVLKEEFWKACNATLEDVLDLEQVYED